MTEISDMRIKSILEQYERKRVREKERYESIKGTEEFKTQNRQRAREHYNLNKESKKTKYENDKDFMNARSSYYYYKRNDDLESFKERYPDKVKVLNDRNITF
tara:strand:+ start:164 stop:472 length:309 start_codon:yes stop_codon:yes gene_type:complete